MDWEMDLVEFILTFWATLIAACRITRSLQSTRTSGAAALSVSQPNYGVRSAMFCEKPLTASVTTTTLPVHARWRAH